MPPPMLGELVKIPLRHGRAALSELRSEVRQLGAAEKLKGADKLQLGAGNHPLPEWANLDLTGNSVIWDLTKPLPVAPGSIHFVYSEHFIEHVGRADAQKIIENCRAVMAPGGVIRISTPDLAVLVKDYSAGKLVEMPHGDWFPETPCRMINEGMHLWGHQFVYDEAEIFELLESAGFSKVERVQRHASDHPELRGLETRPDFDDLIVEGAR